jgi:hypothetical protein
MKKLQPRMRLSVYIIHSVSTLRLPAYIPLTLSPLLHLINLQVPCRAGSRIEAYKQTVTSRSLHHLFIL